MAYTLEAIFMKAEVLQRVEDSAWYRYVVELPQDIVMLPLHNAACEALRLKPGLLGQYFEPTPFETYSTPLAKLLPELSKGAVSAFLSVECFGGPCGRKGVVYRDGEKIYDRFIDEIDDRPMYKWAHITGLQGLVARLRSRPSIKPVHDLDRPPSVTDEVLGLLGVHCESAPDTFDELGLGRYRETAKWPGGPEHEQGEVLG